MEHPIIFFDGVCNLCNSFVQIIIKLDKKAVFRFTSLQSEIGVSLLEKYRLETTRLETVVLIHQGKLFTHSDVVLEIALIFGGFWKIFYLFKIVPKSVRDFIYNWIAKNRYLWFGKKESCWLPTDELRARFL